MPFTGEIAYRCFTGCRECFWDPVKSPCGISLLKEYLAHFPPPERQCNKFHWSDGMIPFPKSQNPICECLGPPLNRCVLGFTMNEGVGVEWYIE